jgi:hypothetical protein
MLQDNFRSVLAVLATQLAARNIVWVVVGSTNMALQGMDVTPHDLDIATHVDNLPIIKGLFAGYQASAITELQTCYEPAWEITCRIADVEVQFLGEHDTGEYVSKLLAQRVMHVPLYDVVIPCLTLDAEAQAYAETGREHKARLIKTFLGIST